MIRPLLLAITLPLLLAACTAPSDTGDAGSDTTVVRPRLQPDIDAGRAIASVCTGCHGMEGMSPNDLWPNLAGQKRSYLEKQLYAFRDGSRVDPVMSTFAAPLSDQDIVDVSAYYASLPRAPAAAGTSP